MDQNDINESELDSRPTPDDNATVERPRDLTIRLAYNMGYADALVRRLPDSDAAVDILSDGVGE